MINGVQSEFQSISHVKFVEDVAQMIFYCLFANMELLRNLTIAESAHDERHDLQFAPT